MKELPEIQVAEPTLDGLLRFLRDVYAWSPPDARAIPR